MKIIQGDQVTLETGTSHRGGVSQWRRLLDGNAGAVDNFSLVWAQSPGRYSPRHRHNFEQIRVQLEGVASYGRTGTMKPGMIGYYPEAVHYGPQTQDEGEMLSSLALQFGGASGSGYIGRDEQAAITKELRSLGEFKNGAFRRNKGVPGKRNLDGFQAIWEHAKQRPLTYPEPRYEAPLLMDPDRFAWLTVDDMPGVQEKPMGVFTECRTMAGLLKLAPEAVFEATGARDIFFVLSGDGMVKGEPWRYATTVFLDRGESARFSAETETEILQLRLPNLDHLKGEDAAGRVAAE
ncbi:MAG: hypothetical protein HOM25_17010 [Rhodospirillaceae bacterium]|jgi:hypothetical protein|nr:hypothetical protein [Rhodospirillaceae bacterium]MBT5664640.1 hypothetical protein [Rhodospirillaceae bacterium]MBT5808866.1 hypothetical protein [Rhodospirillaceae bacterium]